MIEPRNPNNAKEEIPFDIEQPSVSKVYPHRKCSLQEKRDIFVLMTSIVILLLLIAVYIILFASRHGNNVPFTPSTDIQIHATSVPTPYPSQSPTTPSTIPTFLPTYPLPTQSPTGLGRGIREFLFRDSASPNRPTSNPAVTKAIDWMVEEAAEARVALSPFSQKFLQRYGILILYFSVFGEIASATLPNDRMRNQDECSWIGMTCDKDGMLVSIKLDSRGLDGTLPAEWGFFPNLKSIDFVRNNLKGTIPEELYDNLELERVFLYRNQLTGTISPKIGQLWKLTHFHVAHNRISGSIPREMASRSQIRQIQHFNVHHNQMSGVIPRNMRLRQLRYMDLGHNKFSGTLPDELGTESVRLRHLFLDHNDFLGTVPESYVVAGQGRINTLYLNDNKLSGPFPGNGTLFQRMQELHVENNNFDACTWGFFPFETPTELKSTCDICKCRGLYMCRFCNDHPY